MSAGRNIFRWTWKLAGQINWANLKGSLLFIKTYGFPLFLKEVRRRLNEDAIELETDQPVCFEILGKNNACLRGDLDFFQSEFALPETFDPRTSVVIPTLNGGNDLALLLPTLRNQTIRNMEVIIVDSGSTDNTLALAREHGARTITIRPEQFSHSYARNLGAEEANGDYLLFMTQDALPPSPSWVCEMLHPMNDDVAAVSCAESPRGDADLFYRVISWNHYRFLGVNECDRILRLPGRADYPNLRKNAQLSNIACLIKAETFMRYKFRNTFAEDLDLGMRLVKDGYKLAFLGTTRIIHSHNRLPFYHLKRGYVDTIQMRELFSDFPLPRISDADNFAKDILFTSEIISSILGKLHNLALPSRTSTLVASVREALLKPGLNSRRRLSADGFDFKNLDQDLKSFLDLFYPRLGRGEKRKYTGMLILAILGFWNVVSEYLENTYEIVDEYVLPDVRSCLLKGYAAQLGAHMARYSLTEDADQKELSSLDSLLRVGV